VGEGIEGRRTEREKRGRTEGKGRGGKLEQGRRLAKAGPASACIACYATALVKCTIILRMRLLTNSG